MPSVLSAARADSITATASPQTILPPSRQAWTRDQLLRSPYGYQPVLSAPLLFTILYLISAVWHLAQNFKYRQWWLIVLTVGCFAEVGGNALRIHGHYDPFNADVYTAMQCILVLTPALFLAIDFAILGRLTTLFPARYSLVNPRWILPFFVTLDFASLAIQGGGSGVAASAQAEGQNTDAGGHIVVAGLAIQVVGYILFNALLFVFVRRCIKDPPPSSLWNKRSQTFIAATVVSSALIFVRSIFRLIEMCVGWEGVIARSEWCFYTFDAAVVTIAVFIFNVYNPSAYLPKEFSWKDSLEKDPLPLDKSIETPDAMERPTTAPLEAERDSLQSTTDASTPV